MEWRDVDMPAISVIMSVYNDEKYLRYAIDSILNQTFSDFEFIICDDCSTDSSLDIIQSYLSQDPRIVLVKNAVNLGLAASLNKCIQISTADYIARMDSDDISDKRRLELEYKFISENSRYAVVGSKAHVIDEKGHIYKDMIFHKNEVSLLDALKKTQVIHPTVLMNKKALIHVGGYTVNKLTRRAEDYDLWCKLLSQGYQIFNLDLPLLLYREGLSGVKKRKYQFRIQEMKIKFFWMRQQHVSLGTYIYAFKPLIVGLIPTFMMSKYKRGH